MMWKTKQTRRATLTTGDTLIETIPQLVWTARPDGQLASVNQRWCDYTGVTLESIQSDRWAPLPFIHPDDREDRQACWQHALDMGARYEIVCRLRNGTTGSYRWFLTRAEPSFDTTGQIVRWVGTCTDINDQKQAEQQFKESQESLRVLAEMLPHLVWVVGSDGQFEYVNQHWCDYTGLTLEHAQRVPWAHLQVIHPDDRESNRTGWQHALDVGTMFEYEERIRKSQTGEYRWFLSRGMPVRNEAGQIIKWFGTCTDIEDQKRAEEALRQSQERIRALIHSTIIGIVSVEVEGEVIVDANDAWLRMTGYSREEVCSRMLSRGKITLPEQESLFERAVQGLTARGQHTPFETELVCQDGSRLPVLVGGVLFQDHPCQMVAFMLDNSARKELEQRKDDFISMASHELKTPLTAVKLQTQLVRKRLAKHAQHEAAAELSRVESPIKQLDRLITELLCVSKIQAGRLEYVWEQVDLNQLMGEVTDTMQRTNPSHTILVCGNAQTSLIGDRDRLRQVFTNLLSNAIKYSPGAQTVEVELSASDEVVTVRVRDHGLGIPREQRGKIFERFYRTADLRQSAIPGLGMGLYIVAEIIKGHGGTITVDSAVGTGSTFTATLPTKRNT